MGKIPSPLVYLWLSITIPVVAVGAFLYSNIQTMKQQSVVYKEVVVTPEVSSVASPSATATPVLITKAAPRFTTPTVTPIKLGGVK